MVTVVPNLHHTVSVAVALSPSPLIAGEGRKLAPLMSTIVPPDTGPRLGFKVDSCKLGKYVNDVGEPLPVSAEVGRRVKTPLPKSTKTCTSAPCASSSLATAGGAMHASSEDDTKAAVVSIAAPAAVAPSASVSVS